MGCRWLVGNSWVILVNLFGRIGVEFGFGKLVKFYLRIKFIGESSYLTQMTAHKSSVENFC